MCELTLLSKILSEKTLMRKGTKASCFHTWNMLTGNTTDTVRAVGFYCHRLMTKTQTTSISQENTTAWQGPPARHFKRANQPTWIWNGALKIHTEESHRQKEGGWSLCGAEWLPDIIPRGCRQSASQPTWRKRNKYSLSRRHAPRSRPELTHRQGKYLRSGKTAQVHESNRLTSG